MNRPSRPILESIAAGRPSPDARAWARELLAAGRKRGRAPSVTGAEVRAALAQHGTVAAAAEALGVSRDTIERRRNDL